MSAGEYIASALTVAGSDSGGGAGIQADLRTFSALGVFGCSAISALTSQNPLSVRRVDAVPVEGVVSQIEAVTDAVRVSAVKTGMLYSAQIVKAVANSLSKLKVPIVVDPVAVSTSGSPLLKPDAVGALRNKLLPIATWITPNIPEAELLTSMELCCEESMMEAAMECHSRWGCSCVVKGGHSHCDPKHSTDVIFHDGAFYLLTSPRLKVKAHADHGTGCTFSAAFTAFLARGESWDRALVGAKAFVLASLASPVKLSPKVFAMFPPKGRLSLASVKLERL